VNCGERKGKKESAKKRDKTGEAIQTVSKTVMSGERFRDRRHRRRNGGEELWFGFPWNGRGYREKGSKKKKGSASLVKS